MGIGVIHTSKGFKAIVRKNGLVIKIGQNNWFKYEKAYAEALVLLEQCRKAA